MVDRVRREFSDDDIERIAGTYRRWRAKPETLEEKDWETYADTPGFCKSEGLEAIRKFDHVLTPGRYVGAVEDEQSGDFAEDFADLKQRLSEQLHKGGELDAAIKEILSLELFNG